MPDTHTGTTLATTIVFLPILLNSPYLPSLAMTAPLQQRHRARRDFGRHLLWGLHYTTLPIYLLLLMPLAFLMRIAIYIMQPL